MASAIKLMGDLKSTKKIRLLKFASLVLLLIPYLLYVIYVIRGNRGPVDYETFMEIGHRLIIGSKVYGENSYYPIPFVMIFAFFSWLPRPLSMAVWLLVPPISALIITRGNPFVLVFAPLLGNFFGGQTAFFGMLGLWGYRKNADPSKAIGGVFLGLTLIKPQLGIVPLVFAAIQWWKDLRIHKSIPKQAWAWILTLVLIYLPGFFLMPDWLSQWLSYPRPLFERAMSGFVPRTLLYFFTPKTALYWFVLAGIGTILILGIWVLYHRQITLDAAIIWGFIVNPLVHDYDLIQIIPLLDRPAYQLIAVLLSIPGWLVILFAYGNDSAWYVFTIIAPGILCAMLYQKQKTLLQLSKVHIMDES